jgi:uncharacterized membrane protein YphA (DoxX/SURF4 family)
MSITAKLRRAPGRIAAGSFILNAGLGKLSGTPETAKMMHGMAVGTYPFLRAVPPTVFLKLLAITEIGVGALLLLPIFGPRLSGLALTAFSGGLLGLYVRTPGMHDASFRPTQQGTALAKDVWIGGIGLSLLVDGALDRSAS